MSKEIIPQSIKEKIEAQYPVAIYRHIDSNIKNSKLREAAIWGYGLSEERIKELECKVEDLNKCLNKALKF